MYSNGVYSHRILVGIERGLLSRVSQKNGLHKIELAVSSSLPCRQISNTLIMLCVFLILGNNRACCSCWSHSTAQCRWLRLSTSSLCLPPAKEQGVCEALHSSQGTLFTKIKFSTDKTKECCIWSTTSGRLSWTHDTSGSSDRRFNSQLEAFAKNAYLSDTPICYTLL